METSYRTGKIYSAVMTIDTRLPIDNGKAYACKSCQCHCHLCRGHITPALEEMDFKLTEKIFKNLVNA